MSIMCVKNHQKLWEEVEYESMEKQRDIYS